MRRRAPGFPARTEIHVWKIPLGLPAGAPAGTLPRVLEGLARSLSSDERHRAARFRFERDRRRFLAARGALRDILAGYLGLDPGEVRFSYGPAGKPALAPFLGFNLSHSGDLALCAVAAGREVGVDLERVHPVRRLERIAARFFPLGERAALDRLPKPEKTEAFLRLWTRAEALYKVAGGRRRFADCARAAGPSDVFSFTPAPGYVAALAAEGGDWRPILLEWGLG